MCARGNWSWWEEQHADELPKVHTSLSKVFPSTHLSAPGRSCLQNKGFRGIPAPTLQSWERKPLHSYSYPSQLLLPHSIGTFGGHIQQYRWHLRTAFWCMIHLHLFLPCLFLCSILRESPPFYFSLSDRCSSRFLLGRPRSVSIKWGGGGSPNPDPKSFSCKESFFKYYFIGFCVTILGSFFSWNPHGYQCLLFVIHLLEHTWERKEKGLSTKLSCPNFFFW